MFSQILFLERVDFSVDNTTIYTFISTTTTTNYSVQIATTNIKLICYSDTESISWQITLSNGSPHPNSGPTVSINSFNTEKNGVYQCNFGSNINISINLQGTGECVSRYILLDSIQWKQLNRTPRE